MFETIIGGGASLLNNLAVRFNISLGCVNLLEPNDEGQQPGLQWYVRWGLAWPNNITRHDQYWCCLYFIIYRYCEYVQWKRRRIDVVTLVYSKPLMKKTKNWNWCCCWSCSCSQWASRSDEEDKGLIGASRRAWASPTLGSWVQKFLFVFLYACIRRTLCANCRSKCSRVHVRTTADSKATSHRFDTGKWHAFFFQRSSFCNVHACASAVSIMHVLLLQ